MAANKEAIAIILDVGPSMNQAPPGVSTALETAIEGINMILQRKIFAESKDEVALILFGTEETENPLADGENYSNITLKSPLGIPDFNLLQMVQDELQPTETPGDFVDAIVVAIDHLQQATQGKKGISSRRIILFSDLGSPFGDQELDTIVHAMQNTQPKTELIVIGPDIQDDEESNAGDAPKRGGGADAHPDGKAKTAQQRSGEKLIKYILDKVEGECYSFREALPLLSYFQTRQIKPWPWKCRLEIGTVEIPITGYSKVKEYKLKQSWKKVYAQDTNIEPGTLRTFHLDNEEETEVEKEDMVQGYRYGNTIVPMSEADQDNMKYKAEKCLKVLGFTRADFVKRYHYLGDGVISITAEKNDEAAAIALSALINALYETNCVAIARKVYNAIAAPRIGCLIPHIKAKYECLLWVELPFAEDIRSFTFGSLPLSAEDVINKKYKPTDEQLQAVDDLITSMDLTTAIENNDGDTEEALKPMLTFNPYFQRVYQCLQHRVLNPHDPLPDLSPLITSYMTPLEKVVKNSQPVLEHLKKCVKLEVVEQKPKTEQNVFVQQNDDDTRGPPEKKVKLDEDLEGGIKNITKLNVTQVGTVTPVEDFKSLISRRDEDLFEEACDQMQNYIQQIVLQSFGQQNYSKALDCVKALREACIQKMEPNIFNTFLTKFKTFLLTKSKKDFWDLILKEKQVLITKFECEESSVTKEELDQFTAEDVKEDQSSRPQTDETTDDLLMEL
ncbi:X-ray repair cross-complementing protein 5 [Biomphalaria pfeifferi]|uniref:ATP-dependent DNA helicase II subunit 2 n=1 Tax=Biomphalaria pfeifferi TaxID=112525 RepID=A0AAD8FK03_BIOPF|nr:X-ray repair cross-complementing protein 5 [Biomphalaria pfeifferi]